MLKNSYNYIGKGLYTLSDAARLSGVPAARISRWTKGYEFEHHGRKRFSQPIISIETKSNDSNPIISFKDLIEIRFLNAFREHGVSWHAIRIASKRAKDLMQRTHPFSTKIFKTDGRTILADFVDETGDKLLLDLVKNQYAFAKIISKYLYGGLVFNDYDEPQKWFPLGKSKNIVIDPTRSFGAPIIARDGIPTKIIIQAYKSTPSVKDLAAWYETTEQFVEDAIKYENQLKN